MATSSMALSQAGAIDPTKPGTYPVILGEDIRNSGDPTKMFTGIRYNFKPKHLAKKSIQHTSTLTHADGADSNSFDVTFRDNSGGRYVYAGTRISKGSKYVLVFDSKQRLFILHRLDSLFVMNMTDTPTNHDAEALKKKHPHITEKTVRRLRQHRVNGSSSAGGAVHPGRRPPIKKSGSGSNALRPLTKPVSRPVPRPPSVLRSSHEISKKSTSGNSNGSSGSSSSSSVSGGGGGGSGNGSISGKSRSSLLEPPDPSRETKAAKDVRQRREDMITKEARDNRDAREKAAREAAVRKSKAAALAARPKEGSKLSQETKASPDSKAQLAARAAEVRARIGGKTVPGGSETKKGQTAKAREPAQRKQGGGRKAEGGKSVSSSNNSTTGKGRSTTAAKSLPLPMPAATPAAPAPKKKKRRDWAEQEDDDDDDDGDLGIVIEYPEGPSYRGGGGSGGGHAFTGGSGGNGHDRGAPRPQLHMQTFDEFQRDSALGHDGIEEVGPDDDLEGYWDPREDDAAAGEAGAGTSLGLGLGLATAPSPAATPEPALSRPSSSSAQRERYGGNNGAGVSTASRGGKAEEVDEMDELEEALMEELKEEEAEEAARRKQHEEELEAELMAAFEKDRESESEISEEE